MNFCLKCSSWTLSLSMNIDQILLFLLPWWCLSCRTWELEEIGDDRVAITTDRGAKSWRFYFLSARLRVSGAASCWSRNVRRTTSRGSQQQSETTERHARARRKSVAILCVRSFCETSYVLWQQNGGWCQPDKNIFFRENTILSPNYLAVIIFECTANMTWCDVWFLFAFVLHYISDFWLPLWINI